MYMTLLTNDGKTIYGAGVPSVRKLLLNALYDHVSIVNVCLQDLICRNQKFYKVDFTDVDFSNSTLNRSVFKECIFINTVFDGSRMYSCGFLKCTFINCSMVNTKWYMSDINGTSITNCDFHTANLHVVDFVNTVLDNNSFTNACLQSTRFIGTLLDNNNISTATLHRSIGDGKNVHSMYLDGKSIVLTADRIMINDDTITLDKTYEYNYDNVSDDVRTWYYDGESPWRSTIFDIWTRLFPE